MQEDTDLLPASGTVPWQVDGRLSLAQLRICEITFLVVMLAVCNHDYDSGSQPCPGNAC